MSVDVHLRLRRYGWISHDEPTRRGRHARRALRARCTDRLRWHGRRVGRHRPVLQRTVAVKVMRPDTGHEELFALRFRDEAVHSAALLHTNIATLFDYGEDDGLAFLVMELVKGEPLSLLLKRRAPLDPAEVRSLDRTGRPGPRRRPRGPRDPPRREAGQHPGAPGRAGEAHRLRDRPRPRRRRPHPGRRDAGHARLHQPRAGAGRGARPAPATSTPWAWSRTRCSSGRRPFDRGTPVATALSHVNEPPPPLPEGVPEDLASLVRDCLAKNA